MSIAAVTGSTSQLCALQNQYRQVHNQFKQLGQDLQAGALTKAQSDFVTLSQAATSQLERPARIKEVRRDIARIKTLQTERSVAGKA